MYVIRDLDLAMMPSVPAFIKYCQDKGVTFRIDRVQGVNGYPTCELSSDHWDNLPTVLLKYCGGDQQAASDLEDTIQLVEGCTYYGA